MEFCPSKHMNEPHKHYANALEALLGALHKVQKAGVNSWNDDREEVEFAKNRSQRKQFVEQNSLTMAAFRQAFKALPNKEWFLEPLKHVRRWLKEEGVEVAETPTASL
eukprot:g15779.t1